MSWLTESFASALTVVDYDRLVKQAGLHVQPDYVASEGKIRPSLIARECQLQRVKSYLGHEAQPGATWSAARQGQPSAGSALNFIRGFLGEGLVVAALKLYGEMLGEYEIIGCAPEMVFGADDYEAHPDLVLIRQGEIELVQIKCPSVFAFARQAKGGDQMIKQRYEPQVVAEMHIGRLMDIPISRSHIFLVTWEGWPPGTGDGEEIRCLDVEVPWEEGMDVFIESIAQEIRDDALRASQGRWPQALPEEHYDRFPCTYCSYARTQLHPGQIICEENEKWTTQPPLDSASA